MKTKTKKIFFIILAIIPVYFPGGTSLAETHKTLNKALVQYGVRFKKGDGFSIIKDFEVPFREKSFHTLIAKEKDTRIEIEIIKPMPEKTALYYSKCKYEIIKNLYGPQVIPYSGTLTTTTECPDDKKPRETTARIMGRPARVLLANATERYVLGVWEDEMIKQKAAFLVFYDQKNETHYQIIIFQPYGSFDLDKVLNILKGFESIS